MSAVVIGNDFAVLSALRAQLFDERVYLATDEASAVELTARRHPEMIFIEVKRKAELQFVARLVAADAAAIVAIADGRMKVRVADVMSAARPRRHPGGVIPLKAIATLTRIFIDKMRDELHGNDEVTR